MGLFNAAANLFGQVYERATQVAATAVTAVADVARTLVGSTVDAVEQQVHEALTSVHDAVASVEQALESTVGAVAGYARRDRRRRPRHRRAPRSARWAGWPATRWRSPTTCCTGASSRRIT